MKDDSLVATVARGRVGRAGHVRHIVWMLGLAFCLNWIWEATHAAAYVESAGPFVYRLRHCLPMAVTDAVWTFALWMAVSPITRWSEGRVRPAIALAALGAATAVVVERVAVAEGRWTYNALMPIVPILQVGLWPVLQMTLLPVLAVSLARVNR